MKYVEEYLETVVKVKPLGELTTREDILYDMSGEMVYIDGKCSDIFISHADYANWLEKQRQNPAEWHREDEQNLNACLGYIPDEFLRRWLRDIIHVKYDKPADMIESKFKVGDWIFSSVLGTAHIIDVNDSNEYQLEYIDDKQKFSSIDYVNYEYNEWTIQDAKDGDVLVNGSNIFIFHFINDTRLMGYCHVNTDDGRFYDDIGKNECFCLIDAVVNPATKEQRDLLFQKMNEAGYEWDAENKQLKKIGPKFKVDDWVVHDMSDGRKVIRQIINMTNKSYILDGEDFNIFYFNDLENDYHLWTLQDAKDGDILLFEGYYNSIVLFQGIGINGKGRINYHCKCDLGNYSFGIQGDAAYLGTIEKDAEHYHPATKEQREQLEKAMTDAGYTFDFEKKELKKIHMIDEDKAEMDYCFTKMMNGEKVTPAWSEDDEEYNGEDYGIDSLYHAQRILEKTLGEVDGYQTDDGILSHKCAISAVKKLYGQKSATWSKEDENHVISLLERLEGLCRNEFERTRFAINEDQDWLKSLKDKVQPQPKQEWSEEDEDYFDAIITKLEVTQEDAALTDNQLKFLKSLKYKVFPQNHWKPSDEQIEALDNFIFAKYPNIEKYEKSVKSLYNDLKKLKGE